MHSPHINVSNYTTPFLRDGFTDIGALKQLNVHGPVRKSKLRIGNSPPFFILISYNNYFVNLENRISQEEIKRRPNSSNACFHSVQNLLSSRLLSKNIKIGIYKTVMSLVLYGWETWSLTLREEHRLRVFENRVLRRQFGPRRDEMTGDWRKLLVGKPEGKRPLGRPRRR
jgi:hypothetical protein